MRRKIPKNVDVVLEKTQVDASRIVVIELSQCSFLEQLADFLDCAGEQKGMVHHDREILLPGEVDQFLALRSIAGEWLLNEDVLPILQCSLRQLVVRPDRSDDSDSIDLSG